jgi:hypothetical protein
MPCAASASPQVILFLRGANTAGTPMFTSSNLIVDGSHKQIEYHLPNYWMQVHEEHCRALNTQCIEVGDV